MAFRSPRELVRDGAARHGRKVAVRSGDETLTYRALADRTEALARELERAGIGAGTQVALMLPNSIAYIVWYFAIAQSGAIVVPVSPALTTAEAAGLFRTAQMGFAVASEASPLDNALGMARVSGTESFCGASLWGGDGESRTIPTTPWTPDGIFTRQFSSGSTGRPKHMFKSEQAAFYGFTQVCETIGLEEGERYLGAAPFYHSSGAGNLLGVFHLGGSVTAIGRFLPGALIDVARREKPTVFMATPPMIESLASCRLEAGDENVFKQLRHCGCGTGRLRQPVHESFLRRFGVYPRNRYGSSETANAAIDLDDVFEDGLAGRPYVGVELGIFNEAGAPCPEGTSGRVGVRSRATCSAYIDDPINTASTFRSDGFVFPGDVGYLDQQGRLYLLGRSDIINIGGDKVDRLEVERVIREELPVSDVVVLAGERAGQPVVRAVVEADPERVTRRRVIEACRARLASHKVPALVEVRRRFERDANGKVLRVTLDA